MGRKSKPGVVKSKGAHRIEFPIWIEGKLYRPSIEMPSSAKNLKKAQERLNEIYERIEKGTFKFLDEFPDYRYAHTLPAGMQVATEVRSSTTRTCNQVFDDFLAHCTVRVKSNDMAFSTLASYERILNRTWRPKLGEREFLSVKHSDLLAIAVQHGWKTKKTYNNRLSPLRGAFAHEYKDHPELHNPAEQLDDFRIHAIDRPEIDPFYVEEAESIIADMHCEFGQAMGNFDEFRFFTGLRQSEQIGLQIQKCDLANSTITISEVVVCGRGKNRTKTNVNRVVELCPRALGVLRCQLALREQYLQEAKIDHGFVFFQESGQPIRHLSYPYRRWTHVMGKLQLRYREPYNARHTYASWMLMIGKNIGWIAEQLGNSIEVMTERYGRWIKGATESEVAKIQEAIRGKPTALRLSTREDPQIPLDALQADPANPRIDRSEGWGRLSWRKVKQRRLQALLPSDQK